jgi:hypothetical protein
MLYQTVNESNFTDMFINMNREDNFSYRGRVALYQYLEELSESIGKSVEIDIIALCCEFTEYDNLEEFQNAYGDNYKTTEEIEYQTTVIMIDDDSFIIRDF